MWFKDALCWSEDSFCFWSFYVWLLHNGVLRCCLVELGLPWAPEQISGRLELERRNEFFLGPRGGTTVDRMIFREPGNWGRGRRRAEPGFLDSAEKQQTWNFIQTLSIWWSGEVVERRNDAAENIPACGSAWVSLVPNATLCYLRTLAHCSESAHSEVMSRDLLSSLTVVCLFVFIQCLLPKQLMSHILNKYQG